MGLLEPEAVAKERWFSETPEEGTIAWFHRWQAVRCTPETMPDFYVQCWGTLREFEDAQEEFGDDEAWLECLREQYDATV